MYKKKWGLNSKGGAIRKILYIQDTLCKITMEFIQYVITQNLAQIIQPLHITYPITPYMLQKIHSKSNHPKMWHSSPKQIKYTIIRNIYHITSLNILNTLSPHTKYVPYPTGCYLLNNPPITLGSFWIIIEKSML